MGSIIRGIPVVLLSKVQTGVDGFGAPVYEPTEETVNNVLIAPSSAEDIESAVNLTGRKVSYTLAIPKGDTHTWEGCQVRFFGEVWRVVGIPLSGIDANIPGPWNTKVMVERYE